MRVVHVVCSTGFAGVERYLVGIASGLATRGDQVTVVGGDRRRMDAAFEGSGVTWIPGDDMRTAFRSLRRAAEPDVLHTHMSQADLVGYLYRRGRRRAIPQVSTRHFAGPRGSNPLARAVFRPVGRSLAAQIAISEFVAENVEPPAGVVYTGVAESLLSAPRERFVLAVQRLEPEKHTREAIDAWCASRGAERGWTLRIAGDGSERAELEAYVAARGVGDSVQFLGHRSDVDDLLSRAGLLLATTPREGLGISVLEAMAHGTPVVASAGGGHIETVGAVSAEAMYPPGQPEYAAKVMDAFIADAESRAALGSALQRAQRERFTVERQVDGTREIYQRVLR